MSSRDSSPPSLEQSLSRLLSFLLLVVLLVLLAIAAWIGRESAIQFALSRLHHDAEAIINRLDIPTRRITGTVSPIYRQPLSGHYYLVRFEDGAELRSRSLWDEPFGLPNGSTSRPRYWLTAGPREQKLLMWQGSFEKDGETFSIAIAEDVAPLLSAIWRFVWIGIIASVGAVLLILLAQRWFIRRAFARLDHVSREIREVRQGNQRQLDSNVPAEVLPVVREFNQLLTSWRQHQERSRNAVGNLAHALKTPLQLILRHGEKHGDSVIAEQARRMRELIEQELKRARITGRSSGGRHFRPKEDLGHLVETIETLYHPRALRIRTLIDTDDGVPLDQNDMLELVGNLLDNAAKWARQEIILTVTGNTSLRVVLEDDGPGIEAELRETLLVRGSRLDENLPGHGLGLAIAQEIVALYGGQIELGESPGLHGLKIEVSIPLD